MIRVALDVMGGDNAPVSNIRGAILATEADHRVFVKLVGNEELIREALKNEQYDATRITVINASEVIETGEPPVTAIQKKKDSSMVVGLKLLHDGEADAFVSAGSTGALLVGAQVVAGRLKSVKRSPLAVVIPTTKGKSVLIDGGANVDVRPENLLQFALMGSLYAKHVLKIDDPKVGLVNIGTEEEKGNDLTRDTYPLLKASDRLNFIGNAEARDIPFGVADVYVAEAFTGNIVLKMYEGVAKSLLYEIKGAIKSSFVSKIGGLLIKKSLKGLVKQFDSSEDGGAPMLGLNGLVVKAHGNSTEIQIKNGILQCIDFEECDFKSLVQEALS
ncbi:MAG: phosphate acyltransferase PlsX [Lachnospiraceae bacterium]|nr:phosphate acyltransferase PlsX [Lachnospiraceae bacterium]